MFDDFGDLQDLYQQVILDHGRSPRNFRIQEAADGHADGYNPLCGDQVTVFCKLEDNKLTDVSFQGKGCAICTASASMMTQIIKNKSTTEAEAMFEQFHNLLTKDDEDEDAAEQLGKLAVFAGVRKYPMRVKCATLPWHTLKAALNESDDAVSTE